jgi:peptidyl-prolyl cis-trans isomerase C
MNFRRSVLALGAIVATVAFYSFPSEALAEDKVMATLNGEAITEADLALADGEIGNQIGNLPPTTKRRVLIEYLIEMRLFSDAAEAEKLGGSPDFERRKKYWQRRALRDEYFERSIESSIGEGLAKGIYEDKVKMLPVAEEVKARHILVGSEAKAKELAEKIKAGGDFAVLAKENSTDPGSKDKGGLLGYFSKGQMVPEFDSAVFAMKAGDISKPVKSKFGWHIIKVDDRRKKAAPTFDEVKGHIMGSLVQSKAQEVAATLREKASIKYVDADVKKMVAEEAAKAAVQKNIMDAKIKAQQESGAAAKKE